MLLLSEDAKALVTVAQFSPDAESLQLSRDVLLEPILLETHPVARSVLETGEPFFAPRLNLDEMRPPRTTPRYFAFLESIGMHSMLIVALRVHAQPIGILVLTRYRRESAAFDEHDLALAQNLASHASLAISNARLLTEARREPLARARIADRLRVLVDAAREFSAASYDLDALLSVVAHRLGALIGDMCVIRAITADGEWLESTGASYHRDPELLAATRAVMGESRQRVGEGISGRAAASGKPVLMSSVSPAEYAASSEPKYRSFFERLAITSGITLPLVCRGKVVGVANLMRSDPNRPYDEDDFHFAQSVADHAALALGNARLSESGILGIVVGDLSRRIVEVNDALLTLLGYSRDEILSGRVAWKDLTPPEWSEVDARAAALLTESGIGALREKEFICKDGKRVYVLVGSALLDGDAKEVISFVLDLTAHKKAQAALEDLHAERAGELKFRTLLESAPDAMVIVGTDGAIVFLNGQTETVFGYSRTEIGGQPIEFLIPDQGRRECFRRPEKLTILAFKQCGRGAGAARTRISSGAIRSAPMPTSAGPWSSLRSRKRPRPSVSSGSC